MPTPNIEQFLEQHVELFLRNDLAELTRPDVKVGFPLLMAAFAGIELLGGLMADDGFSKRPAAGADYFAQYWANRLYPGRANTEEIGRRLYKLARHGIAHVFFPKGPIAVGRRLRVHLVTDAAGILYVDAAQLADDLIVSYDTQVKPASTAAGGAVNRVTMERQLAGMLSAYEADSLQYSLASLVPTAPTPVAATVTMSAAVSMAYKP